MHACAISAISRLLAVTLLVGGLASVRPAAAKGRKNSEWKLDGRFNLEVISSDDFRQVSFEKEAQLDVEFHRYENIIAAADLRIDAESRGLELRELLLVYEPENGNAWIAGQGKKRFGLQWDQGQEERLSLQRSAINDKLATLSYVGRDSMAAYRIPKPDSGGLAHRISLHSSERLNVAGLYELSWDTSETSVLKSYSMIHAQRLSKEWIVAEVQSFAYATTTAAWRTETELFIGEDFNETEYQQRLGNSRAVYFSSLSFGALWERFRLKPYARLGFILHDLSEAGYHSAEALLGARFYVRKRFYVAGEARLLDTDTTAASERSLIHNPDSQSYFMLALRHYF